MPSLLAVLMSRVEGPLVGNAAHAASQTVMSSNAHRSGLGLTGPALRVPVAAGHNVPTLERADLGEGGETVVCRLLHGLQFGPGQALEKLAVAAPGASEESTLRRRK